jgi:hypothetical protein
MESCEVEIRNKKSEVVAWFEALAYYLVEGSEDNHEK